MLSSTYNTNANHQQDNINLLNIWRFDGLDVDLMGIYFLINSRLINLCSCHQGGGTFFYE